MNVTNNDTINAYDNGVQAYFDASPQIVSDHIKQWIDTALSELPKTSKIFEIGSGTGKDAKYINSLGYNVELTDASQGFVDYLNSNGLNARQFNVLIDEFKDNYDLVFADAVLLHFTEAELTSVFIKIYKALKYGGKLAFTVKMGDGELIDSSKLGMPRYFHLWQFEYLRMILEKCGYEVVYTDVAEDTRGNKPAWIMMIAKKASR